MSFYIFFIAVLFSLGTFFLTLFITSLRAQPRKESKIIFKKMGKLFFYRELFLWFFPKHEYEGLLFSGIVTQNIIRFIAIVSGSFWIFSESIHSLNSFAIILSLLLIGLFFFFFTDYIPRVIGSQYASKILKFAALFSTPFLLLAYPFTLLFLKISEKLRPLTYLDYLNEPLSESRYEILEILQEANFSKNLSPHDKKLIESVISFQNRIAREIMVPRIDLFCLDISTTILEAAKTIENQGYSRVPVYKDSIDQMVGILMYKDVLAKFVEYRDLGNREELLSSTIEALVKPVMYTPETKKISNLLQEFKKKQVHLAIVVDEYGGTEGIVTIEDILEEIVGEIEDEYDQEEDLFTKIADTVFVVDARMSIIDLENELAVVIPDEGDFDTIGGYIFHMAGAIPTKGFTIKHDDFEIEVLKSNDRRVEKVKIKKIIPQKEV